MTTAKYFCTKCRRHYLGERSVCPADGTRLVQVPGGVLREGGEVDGRYLLVDKLATGGMASIYRAVDQETRLEVALKLLQSRYLSSPQLVELFYQEARIIRSIRHENVVALNDFGRTHDGYLYMAMELLRGPTLAEYLWSRELPPFDTALRIFFQIAEALRAAHAAGVIHADLKASNVLFVTDHEEDERVKVLDFGIARLYDEGPFRMSRGEEVLLGGTPQYMSPEQVAGEEIDPRTDLYAAGVLLFQLLVGRLPFDHDDPMEVCRMQREVRPLRISQALPGRRFPRELDALVEELLRKDPEQRPPDAETLYRRTKEILRRTGSPTQPSLPVVTAGDDDDEDDAEFSVEIIEDSSMRRAPPQFRAAVPLPREDELQATPGDSAFSREITLLDVEFRGDDRPFTLLGADAVRLLTAPVLEKSLRELRNVGGVPLQHDAFRVRFAFGFRPAGARDMAAAAVDVALALMARVEEIEAQIAVGLSVRCGLSTGTVFLGSGDRIDPALLVRGSQPDLAARLVQRAPWGGLVLDPPTYHRRAQRLKGAALDEIKARRAPGGLTVFVIDQQTRRAVQR